MKLIITFLCGTLCTGSFCANNNFVIKKLNDICDAIDEFECPNCGSMEELITNENFKSDIFVAYVAKYTDIITMHNDFISDAIVHLENEINNNLEDKNVCDLNLRKLIFSILSEESEKKVYLKYNHVLLYFSNALRKDEIKRLTSSNCILLRYFLIKKIPYLLFNGMGRYKVSIVDHDKTYFNFCVLRPEVASKKTKILQITFDKDKESIPVNSEFIDFCENYLEKYINPTDNTSLKNMEENLLDIFKVNKDRLYCKGGEAYLGILIPDDKYDEAKSIVDGINNMRQTWISRAFNSIFGYFGY